MEGDLDLFGEERGVRAPRAAPGAIADASTPGAPLAARMRPRTLDEFVGQDHLVGPGRALREMIERDELDSMILWGPPGSGKTTLARIIAERTQAAFVPFSAVTEGVPRVREILREAEERLRATGRRTILFCDEIHHFSRAQQDAFLPAVEAGAIILIGSTTENPSFELRGALLSRSRVLVLEALRAEHLETLLRRALEDRERGLAGMGLSVDDGVLGFLAEEADGDARRALSALELAARLVGSGGRITRERAAEAMQLRFARYDKSGEQHYNLISALHKSVRDSDPDGALYWLARMIDGGEDPLYVARRLIRMAAEEIGLADPRALSVAVAAKDAYHFLGSPEGELALAQAAVYLATAPKSNKIYEAWGRALAAARETPSDPVPLHIRNAPTPLLEELGYGRGYRYAHDYPGARVAQEHLPERLRRAQFYRPGDAGYEARVRDRLEEWRRRLEAAEPPRPRPGTGEGAAGSARPPEDPEP